MPYLNQRERKQNDLKLLKLTALKTHTQNKLFINSISGSTVPVTRRPPDRQTDGWTLLSLRNTLTQTRLSETLMRAALLSPSVRLDVASGSGLNMFQPSVY